MKGKIATLIQARGFFWEGGGLNGNKKKEDDKSRRRT
jgi:hypothetical protein